MSSDRSFQTGGAPAPTLWQAATHGRTLTSFLMLAIFSVMVAVAAGYPWPANMMPFIIGIPGMALSALQIALDIHDYRRREGRIDPRTEFERYMDEISEHTKGKVQMEVAEGTTLQVLIEERPEIKALSRSQREVRLFAYFFGFVAVVILFGFWVGVPAFLIAFLRFYARESWKLVAILTAGSWIIMYLLLVVMLSQILFEGFVTKYIWDTWIAD